jgi:hypothetical protein
LAVVRLAVLFSAERIDHRNGPDAVMTGTNVPLRGVADSTRRESAPPAYPELPIFVSQFGQGLLTSGAIGSEYALFGRMVRDELKLFRLF